MMKRILLVALLALGVASQASANPKAEEAIYLRVKSSLKVKIKNPALWGLGTSAPHVVLYIPEHAWHRLKPNEKRDLQAWMPTLVQRAKADRDHHLADFKELPDFATYQAGFDKLKSNSWALVGVRETGSGRSFVVSKILVCGDGDCE